MPLPRLRISANQRHFVTADGRPFFWLADTAWTLPNHLNREDARAYFLNRRAKGFSVIQLVALDPETSPDMRSAYGDPALVDGDPLRPNEAFFRHLDAVIDLAGELGLYVALVPAWGQLVTGDAWDGKAYPRPFTPANARAYGRWLGARYRDRSHLVWVLGGDRHPVHHGVDYLPVWRAMAEGLGHGVTGKQLRWNLADPAWRNLLITYHPTISDDPPVYSSSHWLHDDAWLAFNLLQSGHREHVRNYDQIFHDYHRLPVKPVLDGEPNYEDWHYRNGHGPQVHGAWNVRKRAYWSLFAGACGHAYGHACVWPMIDEARRDERHAFTWREALDRPGARQMAHLRRLVESRPFFAAEPDQAMTTIVDNFLDIRVEVLRATDGGFAFVYATCGGEFPLRNLERLRGPELLAWWFDPREGRVCDSAGQSTSRPFATLPACGAHTFHAPTHGPDQDWVLVLDSTVTGSLPLPPGSGSAVFD